MRDPTADTYKIMDEAGLHTGTFLDAKKSMSRIVIEVRAKLLIGMAAYVKQQEETNDGQTINPQDYHGPESDI